MNRRLTQISKETSFALRHAPERFGLTLDAEGFVDVGELLLALNGRHPNRPPITRADLDEIIATSDKRRFELAGERIRALYGHSVARPIEHEAEVPPRVLYHGTSRRALPHILVEGLLPMGRQKVHLSTNVAGAILVGSRRDAHPPLLVVDSASAHADGIRFFRGNDEVWLADAIPARYLTLLPDNTPKADDVSTAQA